MSPAPLAPAPLRLAVIVGSVRRGRFGPTVAAWFADRARAHGAFTVDVLDPAETPLHPDLASGVPSPFAPALAAAHAFAVVTPEYNHSYPAALKHLIDWHREEWKAKPVGFVSYGGLSGGLRAVEHLRPVFAEVHTVTVRDTVSFHGGRSCFSPTGAPVDAEGCGTAAKTLLDQLTWWATALHTARTTVPYSG